MPASPMAREDKSGAARAAADGLLRGAPGAAGVDAAEVVAFLDAVDHAGLELHSLMLHRRGHVVAEAWAWPYSPCRPRVMHSFAKSVTSCAIGLAIAESRFGLKDKVISFFPDETPASPDPKLAAMTVEDLLTMRTGHASETGGPAWRAIKSSWVAEFFKIPIAHPPGTTYVYTSAASYMLGAILTKTTGQTLHAYLRPRLFEPLGISGETWDVGPDGINPGGNGLTCTTADALKIGILHAQNGVWNGQRLIPEAWIAEATREHAGGRYGYHWVTNWEGAYCALGMFVQMVMVFPKQGATLGLTGAIDGSARILPLMEKHFPKAFHDNLCNDAKAEACLAERLISFAKPQTLPLAPSATAARISGMAFRVEPNPLGVAEIRFDFRPESCLFTLRDADGSYSIAAGLGAWVEGTTNMPGRELHHGYQLKEAAVVAGAVWTGENVLEMTWIFADTAFRDTVRCTFDGLKVTIERSVNVNSAARTLPLLSGAMAPG